MLKKQTANCLSMKDLTSLNITDLLALEAVEKTEIRFK